MIERGLRRDREYMYMHVRGWLASWKALAMSNGILGSQMRPLKCTVGGQSWREIDKQCKDSGFAE